jgi:hypothetical protein
LRQAPGKWSRRCILGYPLLHGAAFQFGEGGGENLQAAFLAMIWFLHPSILRLSFEMRKASGTAPGSPDIKEVGLNRYAVIFSTTIPALALG